jgi:hypothetical protein
MARVIRQFCLSAALVWNFHKQWLAVRTDSWPQGVVTGIGEEDNVPIDMYIFCAVLVTGRSCQYFQSMMLGVSSQRASRPLHEPITTWLVRVSLPQKGEGVRVVHVMKIISKYIPVV